MISNYLKITFRNILKHKGYSFINITGLAIGMACFLLITLWILDELSYDRYHKNAENLYRIEENHYYSGRIYHVNVTPHLLAPALKQEIPEIVDATRYVWRGEMLFKYGEKAFYENGIVAVDPAFFSMFTYPLAQGDKNTILNDPYSLVISKEIAQKYFGDDDPIGKTISINNQYDFTVKGVLKKIPTNSNLRFKILIPYEFLKITGHSNDYWGNNSILTFAQLQSNSQPQQVEEKIKNFIKAHNEELVTELTMMPLTRIHLHQYWGYERSMGNIQYVYIFAIIALFMLIIACINFMNLSTARSASRAKEVGLRKVVGAMKLHIIKQFFGESLIFTFIALVIALVIVHFFIPSFNTLSGKDLSINIFENWQILLGLVGVTLFTGIVAGSYPALFLSRFQPVKVLKGSLHSGVKSGVFRKFLVITQFSLSIFLIICTIVVFNQLNYMKNKKLGYDKEHVVYIDLRGDTRNFYQAFKNELLKDRRILGVTGSQQRPSRIGSNSSSVDWEGKDPDSKVLIGVNRVDFDFTKTMKIDLVEGRDFSRDFSTDTSSAFLVNEEVLKVMGTNSAVGKRFSFMGADGKIIGVMKNFHYQPVSEKIEPLAMRFATTQNIEYALIRIQPEKISETIEFIKNTWQKTVANYPFEYKFLDQDFEQMYRSDERMGTILKYFAILAIFIACLGLFGLTSFTAEQRTKEMGIRKTLGATGLQISYLFCKEFFILLILANLVTMPLAWYAGHRWLEDFAYRIHLQPGIFLISAFAALFIALLTISYQTVKSALTNPVHALRYE